MRTRPDTEKAIVPPVLRAYEISGIQVMRSYEMDQIGGNNINLVNLVAAARWQRSRTETIVPSTPDLIGQY